MLYYLADLLTRPTGHSPSRTSAPYVSWVGGRGRTVALAEARAFTAAELADEDLDAFLVVPAPLAARLAVAAAPGSGARGPVLVNHAGIWATLDGAAGVCEAA